MQLLARFARPKGVSDVRKPVTKIRSSGRQASGLSSTIAGSRGALRRVRGFG